MKTYRQIVEESAADIQEMFPWDLDERIKNGEDILLVDLRDSDRAVELVQHWRERYDQALLAVDQVEELFTIQPPEAGGPYYHFSGDGQRFLVVPSAVQRADTLLNLIVNWPRTIAQRK